MGAYKDFLIDVETAVGEALAKGLRNELEIIAHVKLAVPMADSFTIRSFMDRIEYSDEYQLQVG